MLRQRGARKEAVTARVTGPGAGAGIRRAGRRTPHLGAFSQREARADLKAQR